MAKAGGSGVFEKAPNAQTVRFAGKFINLSAIARAQGLDVSYLSRIFAGTRVPTLPYCIKIAAMLGLTLDEYVEAMEVRKRELKEGVAALITSMSTREDNLNKKDLEALKQGKPAMPRIPIRKIS